MHAPEPQTKILLITCPDQLGLIHRITGVLFRHDANIVSNDEFVEPETRQFFMRSEFTGEVDPNALTAEIKELIGLGANVRIGDQAAKEIVVFASKEPYCVGDLLLRQSTGQLNIRIQAVISNHDVAESLARRFDVPFHHVPCREGEERMDHERRILSVLSGYSPEFLVLAKYMRVLSGEFVARHTDRIINIHHSFLPAFIGAEPYQQAHRRGVKVIGATAHFVNENLDAGPIIVQDVLRITHSHTPASMALQGRQIEKTVLCRALELVCEERVFVFKNRTVVFE